MDEQKFEGRLRDFENFQSLLQMQTIFFNHFNILFTIDTLHFNFSAL